MASEQKEGQFAVSSNCEAGAPPPADKFEDLVEGLLRFIWRFAVTAVSFVFIPRSATRRSVNPSQARTYVSPLTFVAICSALLPSIVSLVMSLRPTGKLAEKVQSILQTWHFSLSDLAETSIPGIAVIFLGSWTFGKIFFLPGQGRQRFQSLACYAWGGQCIIVILAFALEFCADFWKNGLLMRTLPWLLLYGFLAPSIIVLLGAGTLYHSTGRFRVGVLRYFAIGFFSLVLTVTFLSAGTLTAVTLNTLRETKPTAPTAIRIPYVSAVVEQNSPDVILLVVVVLNNNSDREFLVRPKYVYFSIQDEGQRLSQPNGQQKPVAGHVSEVLDLGGRVIPVAILRPKTTDTVQCRTVFHPVNKSVLTGWGKLHFYFLLKDIMGSFVQVQTDWKINLSIEGLQELEPYTATDAMVEKRLQQSQKH